MFFFLNQGSEQGNDVEATVGKRQISSQWPWRSSVQFRISVSNKVMALCRVCHSHRICDLVSDCYVTLFDLFSIISYIILEHLVFSTSEHPLEKSWLLIPRSGIYQEIMGKATSSLCPLIFNLLIYDALRCNLGAGQRLFILTKFQCIIGLF